MTTAPASISFVYKDKPVTIPLPKQGDTELDSVFVVGLPKAGSTLLNRIMRPLCTRAGLNPFSLSNALEDIGLKPSDCPVELANLYQPKGFAYVGYRGLLVDRPLPDFANNRTVFLVRDPRDMLVSLYFSKAYSHRPPGTTADDALAKAFAEQRAAALTLDIDQYVLSNAPMIAQSFIATDRALSNIKHRTWRYEDVVFEKLKWTQQMLNYLGIKLPLPFIRQVVDNNDVRPVAEEVDKHVRRVTPGDHREKLKPATIQMLNEILERPLKRYKYE